jgi:hypothetical protein
MHSDPELRGSPEGAIVNVKNHTPARAAIQAIDARPFGHDPVQQAKLRQHRLPGRLDHYPRSNRLRFLETFEQDDALALSGKK